MAGLAWKVAVGGHEIPAPVSLHLMPAGATPFDDRRIIRARPGQAWRESQPLKDNPDLFLEFLNLPLTDDALVGFADRHGLLGLPAVEGGELLSDWAEQIRLVGGAFWAWEVHEGRLAWDSARAFVGAEYARLAQDPRERPKTSDREVFKRWKADAEAFKVELTRQVQRVIDENLGHFSGHSLTRNDDGVLSWSQWPRTLIGAIWLQVLWHVLGTYRWHLCPRRGCHEWVGNDMAREGRRRIYCRDACRVAAGKARKREQDKQQQDKRRRQARKGRQ